MENKIKDEEKNLTLMTKMYNELHLKIAEWLNEDGADPLSVAAILMTTSLRIYRTTLSNSDFDQMVDYLSAVRDSIEKFPSPDEYKTKMIKMN